MLLKVTITLEGPAGELAARLRSVAAALEDPAPLAAPEHAPNSNNVRVAALEDPWVPLAAPAAPPDAPEPTPEPEQAPPRQNGQTPEQAAALEAYRASLPKRTPPAPPAPRPAVVAEIHAPARVEAMPAARERPRRKPAPPAPSPVAQVEASEPAAPAPRERTARELWESIRDVPDKLAWHVELAKQRGWPPLILRWSPVMVTEARAAWYAPDRPMWNDRPA
jgi:hypothetical protein